MLMLLMTQQRKWEVTAAINDYRRIALSDNVDDISKIKMKLVDDDVIDADSNKILKKAVDTPTVINIIAQSKWPFAK